MTRPENCFQTLATVPVHYDRFKAPYNYGTRGKPYSFHAEKEFHNKLRTCFKELWTISPYGKAEVVVSAGAWTAKVGWHEKGKAFDLDGIFWPDQELIAHNYIIYPALYLAVEAVIRKHFGTVFNYYYNPSHRDHLHIQDDGIAVGFRKVRSITLFIQASLVEVFHKDVVIDGEWGRNTETALTTLLKDLSLELDLDKVDDWKRLLDQIANVGFLKQVQSHNIESPLTLFEDIYKVMSRELSESESRKEIEAAVNLFAEHPKTIEWLESFR